MKRKWASHQIGCNTDLRTSISALGLPYVAGILPNTSVWTPDTGRGQPPKRLRRDHKHQPTPVKELALGLPKRAWRTIKWREGSAEWLSSRFFATLPATWHSIL